MKDELNYKDFYLEETIELDKAGNVPKNSQIFLWGGWILSSILFVVFIFSSGGDVKGSADSERSFLGNLIFATNKTFATIFGTGSGEHLVETIDLNSEDGNLRITDENTEGLRNASMENYANVSMKSVPRTVEKININTAGQIELDQIAGVGPATAQKIIDHRNINGQFYKIEDIKNVSGIGDVAFEKMKDQITVGNVKPPLPVPVPAPKPIPVPPPPAPLLVTQPVPISPQPTPSPQPAPVSPEPSLTPEPLPAVPPPVPVPTPESIPVPLPPAVPPSEPPPPSTSSGQAEPSPSPASSSDANHILISEVMVGNDENAKYEFIELYNPTANEVDLTGWFIKKEVSTGTESSLLVTSRLEGKIIPPGKYFLAVNASYVSLPGDVTWAASNTLAYTNNSITLYDGSGAVIDSAAWTDIPKNESLVRDSWDSSTYHIVSTPTPWSSSQQ